MLVATDKRRQVRWSAEGARKPLLGPRIRRPPGRHRRDRFFLAQRHRDGIALQYLAKELQVPVETGERFVQLGVERPPGDGECDPLECLTMLGCVDRIAADGNVTQRQHESFQDVVELTGCLDLVPRNTAVGGDEAQLRQRSLGPPGHRVGEVLGSQLVIIEVDESEEMPTDRIVRSDTEHPLHCWVDELDHAHPVDDHEHVVDVGEHRCKMHFVGSQRFPIAVGRASWPACRRPAAPSRSRPTSKPAGRGTTTDRAAQRAGCRAAAVRRASILRGRCRTQIPAPRPRASRLRRQWNQAS